MSFMDFTNEDVDKFISKNENINTLRKTLSHIKLFQAFLTKEGKSDDVQNIPPNELDEYLSKFIISVRQDKEVVRKRIKHYLIR